MAKLFAAQLVTLLVLVASKLICVSSQNTEDDPVFQDGVNGSAVVLLAVARIQQSGAFGNDNDMLRRLAYVETRDGALPDTFRVGYNGGLWAVDEDPFLQTKNTVLNNRLPVKLQQVEQLLGINWQSVQWMDLRKPIYSALAARLILFTANSAVPSTSDLEAQGRFWIQYYNPGGDLSEFISLSSGLQGSVLESSANKFFVGFARNLELDQLSLFVTTSEPLPVNFVVTAIGFSFSGMATSNTSTQVIIPNTFQVQSTADRNKGIYIKAEGDRKITVYGLSYAEFTSDAYLALPCNPLAVDEYVYYGVTYSVSSWPSLLLIVACEDNTLVSTSSTTITLDRLQTYQIESLADLTGMKITTSKPVSVFSSQECTNIPTSNFCCCDVLTEQIPPTSTWGKKFLVAALLGRNSGERIRIISAESANVAVNCSTSTEPRVYPLTNAGDWTEIEIVSNSICHIQSSSPIFVSQFSSSFDADGEAGDPFMMMIPPVEQYSNNYVFDVLPDFSTNYITMYVAPEYFQPQIIFLDSSVIDEWVAVYCSSGSICGYVSRVFVSSGEHRLYHKDPAGRIGVSAYGFNMHNSYGYPGGLRLIPVQLATVSFSSSTYRDDEGNGNIQISIMRSGATDNVAIVLITTDNFQGTASAGEDYEILTEIVEFQVGEVEKSVLITIFDDKRIEQNETFSVYLTGGAGVHLSPISRAEITIENNDGMISLDPSYGSMLGGTGIIVTITGSMTISEDDQIACIFDGVEVPGIYLNKDKSLCVSPLLAKPGRVVFELIVNHPDQNFVIFTAESVFTSLSFTDAFEVYIDNDDLVFSSGATVRVQWSPKSIFPMETADAYTVDIDLLELNTKTGEWHELMMLGSDIPNSGLAEVRVPDVQEEDTFEDSLSPVVVRVGLSSASTNGSGITKRGVVSDVLKRLGRFALKTIKNAPVRYLKKLARQAVQRALCELWSKLEPSNIGDDIVNRLPPCPRRLRDVRAQNSGFKEERLSSIIGVVGQIQDYFGTTVIDDQFRQFFHPGTDSCFRQRVTDRSQTGGSGQQCCYGNDGLLIVGPPGGGTVDRVSPDIDLIGHFRHDVLPYLLCCKAGIFSDCEEYYDNRPSDRGFDYSPPPPPACVYGDPHIITLDGHKYTFNGKGEFVLIEMEDESFTLQARMVPVNSSSGNTSLATVFTAIVAKQLDSDMAQFEIAENGTMVLVNGDQIDFSAIKEQEFSNLTITDLGNSSYSASFSSGAYVEVKEENGIFSVLIVSLPNGFEGGQSHGLMGSFNGNTSDDLLPKLSLEPLHLNSSLQEIHELFGVTWIIDIPRDSLFSYQPGESWGTYYDPFFVPSYEPVFSDATLESQATSLCGGDIFCLFDVAATGRTDIGLSTLVGGQNYERILELQIPVVCRMPCGNGVCVVNDTCKCAAGYSGDYCTVPVFSECEESPCENGGTCTRHVLSYQCECPPTHSGDLCEIAMSSGDNVGLAVGIVFGVVFVILVIAGILAVVIVIKKKPPKAKERYDVTAVKMSDVSDSNEVK